MATHTLLVLLAGERIGELSQDGSGRLRFSYDDEYRFRRDATPLSLSMPLVTAEHPHDVVSPFLWGILPDNPDVLRRWGRMHGVSPRNPFALLTAVGEDCAGAVQFLRHERLGAFEESEPIEWRSAGQIAEKIRELRDDPTAWHMSTATGQFSLAGAQPKVALFFARSKWGVPRGRTPTTHILKPAVSSLDDHDLNEHLCLVAARDLGLSAARSWIQTFDTERAVVIERYDRAYEAGAWLRIHQEDACQALGLHPDSKYEADGGPSAAAVAELLQSVQPQEIADQSIARLLDALAFNWLIAGTDAHAKNYSLLLSGPDVRLAPLYDVASALPYDFHVPKLQLAMSVHGEYRLGIISRRHWERLAAALGHDADQLIQRIDEIASHLPDAIDKACSDPAIAELESDLPQRLAEGVRSWAQHCRRELKR